MNEKWHDSQWVRRGMECPGGKLSQPGSKRLINQQIPSVRPLASVVSEVLQCQFPATWTFSEWYLKTMTPRYSNRCDGALGQRRRLQQGNSTWSSVSIWSIMVSSPTAFMSAPPGGPGDSSTDKQTVPDGLHIAECSGDPETRTQQVLPMNTTRVQLATPTCGAAFQEVVRIRWQWSTNVSKLGNLTPCWNDQRMHPTPDDSVTDGCRTSLPEPYPQWKRMSWQEAWTLHQPLRRFQCPRL